MNALNRRFPKFTQLFFYYGSFLWVIGIVGYLSNPEKAITALFSGGLFGSISIVLALLYKKLPKIASIGAFIVLLLLSVVFSWRSYVSWQGVLAGNAEKQLAAVLISSMLAASILTLGILIKNCKRE